MSVINQMLRDLDKQQGKIPSPSVPQPVFARSTRGGGWRWLIPIALLVLLGLQWQPQLVSAGWAWFVAVMREQPEPVVAQSAAQAVAAIPATVAAAAPAEPAQQAVAATPLAAMLQPAESAALPSAMATEASTDTPQSVPAEPAPAKAGVAQQNEPMPAELAQATETSVATDTEVLAEQPTAALAASAQATTLFEPQTWTAPLATPVALAPSQLQIEQLPEQPDIQLSLLQQRAQQAASEQQLLQAVALWQQYQQLAPDRALAYEQLAQLWWQQQQWPQLAQVLAQAQSRQIQSTTLALQQARLAASQQQWSQVLTALAQWPVTAPLTEVLPLRAQAQQQLADYPAALASYQQLVQLQPDSARAWLGQALVYDQLQQTPAAIAAYRQALTLGGLAPASQQFIQQRLAQTE